MKKATLELLEELQEHHKDLKQKLHIILDEIEKNSKLIDIIEKNG